MFTYRVDKDGVTVWEDSSDEYLGATHFPQEYWGPSMSSIIEWFVDDIRISHIQPEV
jgi:hypothetical protein